MDKFVVSLPRGSSSSSSSSSSSAAFKRKSSPSAHSSTSNQNCTKVAKPSTAQGGRPLSQMFLDLGQKSFGANKQCALCGMVFVIGDTDDEKRHMSFCSKATVGPMLSSTKGFPTIATFNDGRDLVISVKMGPKRVQQAAIDAILQVVQTELGSELDFVGADSESGECETVLLYLRNKSVLGCLVIESVRPAKLVALSEKVTATEAFVSTAPSSSSSSSSSSVANKENATESTINASGEVAHLSRPESSTLGVKLIWVLATCRRQGIAANLIDTSRKTFEFGRVVSREHVAFSQPTSDGLALALSYCRSSQIWGYA